jgi:EAL domain-containing protein (putative c-di-GMP-specific phosphodiesterase class I)
MGRLLESRFDVIKLDRSLVAALGEPRGVEVVSGILDLARRLGATTVAEGIENATQLAELRQVGCDLGQGDHFSAPLPASELASMLVVSGRREIASAGRGGLTSRIARQER